MFGQQDSVDLVDADDDSQEDQLEEEEEKYLDIPWITPAETCEYVL